MKHRNDVMNIVRDQSLLPGESAAYPLDEFYARSGLALPPMDHIEGEAVPEPYRSLLVHDRDMTSTLESFHQSGIHLRLVSQQQRGEDYFREVVLVLDGSETPVEFGAIRIDLGCFPAKAREQILAAQFPLGRILKDHGLEYRSHPKSFLRIASDKTINRFLGLNGANVLFGRRNTLRTAEGRSMAEIVEILPPSGRAG